MQLKTKKVHPTGNRRSLNKVKRGQIIIISGPSQVGKDAVLKGLGPYFHYLNIVKVVTYTTRPKRLNEKEGIDHFFITKQEFQKKKKQQAFLEWAPVRDYYFGTPQAQMQTLLKQGKNVLLKIDVRGVKQLKKKLRNLITIFIKPDSFKDIERRFKKAKFSPQQIQVRLKELKNEMKESKNYDWIVTNFEGQLKRTVSQVYQILKLTLRGF